MHVRLQVRAMHWAIAACKYSNKVPFGFHAIKHQSCCSGPIRACRQRRHPKQAVSARSALHGGPASAGSDKLESFSQNQGERCDQFNNQLDYLSDVPRGDCGRSPHTAAIRVATAGIPPLYSILVLVVGVGRAAEAAARSTIHIMAFHGQRNIVRISSNSSITESR